MEFLSRIFSRRNTQWMSINRDTWANTSGHKIVINDDIAICVSTLENEIMHILAINHLNKRYDIFITHGPDHNISFTRSITNVIRDIGNRLLPASQRNNIFGMSLETAIMVDRRRHNYQKPRINYQYNMHVPLFIIDSIRCVEQFGVAAEGIFQNTGDPVKLFEIKTLLTNGQEYKFMETEVYEVATLLKIYLYEMPEGIFTESMEYYFVKVTEHGIPERVKILNLLVQVLPRANREVLFLLLSLLHRISLVPENGMGSRRLNDVFSPLLFRYKSIVESSSMGILQTFIEYFPLIFTLKARHLNSIYKEIAAKYPAKLNKCLKRRTDQCHCDPSDIPKRLHILTKQSRSTVYIYHDVMHYSHKDCRILRRPTWKLERNTIPKPNIPDPIYEEIGEVDSSNQFPGFDIVEDDDAS